MLMAEYPDWVMKHKKKGTYVNYVKGKYYLYAAHSERIPGTKKVRRVSDGYIGRITEEEGLIPASDKVSGDVVVYEYGLCMTVLDLCGDIAKGLRREFRGATDWILVSGIISAAYGICSPEIFRWSYLSVQFQDINILKIPTDKQRIGIERCTRMVSDVMRKHFASDIDEIIKRLSRVYTVSINGRFYRAKIDEDMKQWLLNKNLRGDLFE